MDLSHRMFLVVLMAQLFVTVNSVCTTDSTNRRSRYSDVYVICTAVSFNSNAMKGFDYYDRVRVRHLKILNSNISELPVSSFIDISNIVDLDLFNNSITKINPGSFNGLHELNKLNLSNNNLTDITQGVFSSLIKLNTLDLSENKIKHLDSNFLSGVINLVEIDLSRNALNEFDDILLIHSKFPILKLNISSNNLSKCILNKTAIQIKSLDVSNNSLDVFDICFPGLESLNISSNKMKQFLANNCSNIRIHNLDLSFNMFNSSNLKNITHLITLNNLIMRNNNLTYIPINFINQFKNLRYLDLSHNDLQNLNYGLFDYLTELVYLDLSYNKLISIKRYLYSLRKLQTLYLNNNNLMNFDSEVLKKLINLREVNLDKNNFCCDDLIEIVEYLGKKVIKGTESNYSNVQGIFCNELEDSNSRFKQEFVSYLTNLIFSKLKPTQDSEFERSIMYNYFNKDFQNSNFYKYLESLKNVGNLNKSDFIRYFNEDFEKSKFFKLLLETNTNENSISKFNKSLYNYFNSDFNASNLVKNERSAFLNNKTSNRGFFITFTILLVALVVIQGAKFYTKTIKNKVILHEQVELIS